MLSFFSFLNLSFSTYLIGQLCLQGAQSLNSGSAFYFPQKMEKAGIQEKKVEGKELAVGVAEPWNQGVIMMSDELGLR